MINLMRDESKALHASRRIEAFKLELLDKNNVKKNDLEMLDGQLEIDKNTAIQKAGSLSFRQPGFAINYLSDKVRIIYRLKVGESWKDYSLGIYNMIKPIENNGIVETQVYDEAIILQQARYLEPKLFLEGTLYTEVLSQILTSCKLIKVNIEPSTLTLQSDLIFDDSKSKLEWFNTIAKQINYNPLSVNAEGWFISSKYKEPSPLNVGYVYEANQLSVLLGEPNTTIDFWQVPNIFKRVVSHPVVGEMVSIYINDNPTDLFSTYNRHEIVDTQIIENIANQIELDNLTRKAAFEAKQVTQEVAFNTLIMPQHGVGDILELRHDKLKGIFVEQGYTIQLKSGGVMSHRVKRLVQLDDKI